MIGKRYYVDSSTFATSYRFVPTETSFVPIGVVTDVDPANPSMVMVNVSGVGPANGKRIADEIRRRQRDLDRVQRGAAEAAAAYVVQCTMERLTADAMRDRERGRGIINVPGVPQRSEVTVGYDDPTGDDVAADVGPRCKR